jgi:hypothetical protein
MRLSRLGLVLVLLGSRNALAQVPVAPAPQPAPTDAARLAPPAEPPAPTPPPPGEVVEPAAPPVVEPAPPPIAEPATEPVAQPAPTKAPKPEGPAALPLDAAGTIAVPRTREEALAPAPWPRAHSPLTLEGRLGFLMRPDSGVGFDDESNVGAELGFSLYLDLKRELSAGLEIERASLGRGTAISGLDSVSIDYTVSSAMLGLRAYPKRSELLDVFVGFQVGVGIQGVSATGTANNGGLLPASSYRCGASDAPAFQIGGGIGARLMLSPRWGLTARINGTGRRLTGDVVEDCAQGIGTATTLSAGLGLGYDFDMDP